MLALTLTGCGGFFEDNPGFIETDASSGGAVPGSSTTGESSADTTGSSPVCQPDGFGANDDQASAVMLPEFAMMSNSAVVEAELQGAGAEDWFTYSGRENGTGPRQAKAFLEGQLALRVCVYLACFDGQPIVVDCGQGDDFVSPLGDPGCCADTEVSTSHECGGSPGGDVVATVRVSDGLDRGECLPYSLDYRF